MARSCEEIVWKIGRSIVDPVGLTASERLYVVEYLRASVELMLSSESDRQVQIINTIAYAEENAVRLSENSVGMKVLLEDIDTAVNWT